MLLSTMWANLALYSSTGSKDELVRSADAFDVSDNKVVGSGQRHEGNFRKLGKHDIIPDVVDFYMNGFQAFRPLLPRRRTGSHQESKANGEKFFLQCPHISIHVLSFCHFHIKNALKSQQPYTAT